MRRSKLIYAVFAFLILFIPIQLSACNINSGKSDFSYVAIGGSIAFGLGASSPEKCYTELLHEFIDKRTGGAKFTNLGIPGITSSHLLLLLTNPQKFAAAIPEDNPYASVAREACAKTTEAVSNADFITVCIGGNNLLGDLPNYIQGNSTKTEESVRQFTADWPNILKAIRQLNPNAKVYAMTTYNPFRQGDMLPTQNGAIDMFTETDKLVRTLNASITDSTTVNRYKYKVVDVYSYFITYKNAKKPLTHFYESADIAKRDPHPTDLGYYKIFELHKEIALKNVQ
ncbi:MAG: SGNH/GDSL hydrolase family protein [Clostridia bacterium]|nr:SGNH/GDSL hydrolase family protein [Clostridia bacterium]